MSAWYLVYSTAHCLIAPLSLSQHTAEHALLSNCIVMSFAVLGHVHLHFLHNNGKIMSTSSTVARSYMQAQTDLRLNNVIWRSNLHQPLQVSHKASETIAGAV